MGKWSALAVILATASVGVAAPAWAEMPRRISMTDAAASVEEHSYLALRCVELAPGANRMPELVPGLGRQAMEAAPAEDADDLPARVYGFAFASEEDEEPACALRQARRAQPGA